VFPSPEFENWWRCERLIEQAQAIDRHKATQTTELARLLNQTGYFLDEQGRYSEAEPYFLQALQIYQTQLGQAHPDTASSLNNLALLYQSQGRYSEAEPYYLQALQIRQTQLGQAHPDTATSLNNLARVVPCSRALQ
jgi:tetratricopeptide (TPR) repeat protein